jgi:hypothetical protein
VSISAHFASILALIPFPGVDSYYTNRYSAKDKPSTLTQGKPDFPGSSRLGIEPKTPTDLGGLQIPDVLVVRSCSR